MVCDEGLCARVLDWLTAYTYPIVFASTLVDASGVPFPGRLLLVAAGALAGTGRRSVVTIIVLGVVAAMIMDHVWFFMAARGSRRMLRLVRRLSGGSRHRSEAVAGYVARYGAILIVVGRFSTAIRALAWPAVSAHGIGYAKFVMLDFAGATLWTSTWVLLGWMVGGQWRSEAQAANLWLGLGGLAVAAAAVSPLAVRLVRSRRRRATTS